MSFPLLGPLAGLWVPVCGSSETVSCVCPGAEEPCVGNILAGTLG